MSWNRTCAFFGLLSLLLATSAVPALAGDLNEVLNTAWRITWTHESQAFANTIYLYDEITSYKPVQAIPAVNAVAMHNRNCYNGYCISGDLSQALLQYFASQGVELPDTTFEYLALVIDTQTTDSYYFAFNTTGDTLSGYYTEDGWDDFVPLTGTAVTNDHGICDADFPTPEGDYTYVVPYAPKYADFALGFGLSNVDNVVPTSVYVEYFNNDGFKIYQDSLTGGTALPGRGHTNFFCGQALAEDGWIKVTSTNPLYGMALVFGFNADPLFDMDLKDHPSTDLTAAHVDTSGWSSKAMLANPNSYPAQVTVTFYDNDGTSQIDTLVIPKQGSVQYNVGDAFPNQAGTLKIASDVGIVGFLLYDGRGIDNPLSDFNYVGGLSITDSNY